MYDLELHNVITKSEIIVGEYQILNHLLTYDYPASKKIGNSKNIIQNCFEC